MTLALMPHCADTDELIEFLSAVEPDNELVPAAFSGLVKNVGRDNKAGLIISTNRMSEDMGISFVRYLLAEGVISEDDRIKLADDEFCKVGGDPEASITVWAFRVR